MKTIKETVYSPENPNGIEREIQVPEDTGTPKTRLEEMAEKQAIKDSAKAKLMSGEALTEDEANTIVL
tara:strand:- start:171 stop:374 length:204 start_codon:yes stop_codon:yes gene_type:complete